MKNQELVDLGLKIKYFRKKLNISQEQLAQKCNFDRTYISLIERGKRNLSYLNLLQLAKGLEVSLCEILSINFPNQVRSE